MKRIFEMCDEDCDGFLNMAEMYKLDILLGFDRGEKEWYTAYEEFCKKIGADPNIGVSESSLYAIMNEESVTGNYYHTEFLRAVLSKGALIRECDVAPFV